jgi:hypothetical protein
MKRIISSTIGLGLVMLASLVGSPAQASYSGAYSAGADTLQCTQFVTQDGDGGTLSVNMWSREIRPDTDHFRGALASTRLVAQEKSYDGTWVKVARTEKYYGYPYLTDVSGGVATSYFNYSGTTYPRFTIDVAGQDDLFRVVVKTKIWSDEGARLAKLRDVQGNCRL